MFVHGFVISFFGVLILVLKGRVEGHVTLTFPPARQLEVDFLNNFGPKDPVGCPKVRHEKAAKSFIIIEQVL